MGEVVIYTDGGARGNPGPAGAGAVIIKDGKEVATVSKFLGVETNNVAEYEALILALEAAHENIKDLSKHRVTVRMDSELIVKQIKGEYRVKNHRLKEQHARATRLIASYVPHVAFMHVMRENNTRADQLANDAMDSHSR